MFPPKTKEIIGFGIFGMKRVDNLRPYQVDALNDGSVSYMRFHPGDADGVCTIVRITTTVTDTNTLTTTEVAVGAWADRATLTYEPINGSDYNE